MNPKIKAFIIPFIFLLSIVLVSSDITITNFYNSTNDSLGDSTNLSFDQAESNFVYLQVQKNSTIVNGTLNLSGYIYGWRSIDSFSVSSEMNNPQGIEWVSSFVYVLDNSVDTWIYKYYPNGTYTGTRFNLSGEINGTYDSAVGLDWNGTVFAVSVRNEVVVTNNRVVFYDSSGSYTGVSFNTNMDAVFGISWNGSDWLVLGENGSDFSVYVYNIAGIFTGRNYSITARTSGGTAIECVGAYCYISYRGRDVIAKIDSDGTELRADYVGDINDRPTGLSWNGTNLWMAGEYPTEEIYVLENTTITNLSLDIANNSNIDWSMTGELNSINSPQNITLNTTAIQNYVDTNNADANGYVYVPLNFTSDTAGIVEVDALELWYNDNPMTIDFVNPTEANDSKITKNWTYINVTSVADVDNPLNIDTCTLNFNGNSTAMTKVGTGTSVSCYFNKTNVPGGYYIYNVTVNNTGGGKNTSETRYLAMDATAPVISAVSHGPSTTFATIVWTTDDASDSLVRYGLNTGVYTDTVSSNNNVTSHALTITNLTADTLYYYVVNSTNRAGLNSQSSEKIFLTTLAGSAGQTSGSSGGGGIAPPPEVVEIEKEVLVFPKAKIELSRTSGREEILLIYKDKNASKYFFIKNIGYNKTTINITTSNSLKPFVDAYFLEMDFSRPEHIKTIRAGESKIIYLEVQGLYPDYNINNGVEGTVIIATPEGVANIIIQVVRPPAYNFLIKPFSDFLEGKVKGNPEHYVMIPMYLLTVALFGFLVYVIRK